MELSERTRGYAALAGEILVAFGIAALLVWSCAYVKIDANDRVGFVSILATVGLRVVTFSIPIVIALVISAKWRDRAYFAIASRFACAAVAGLASASIAAGLLMSLKGTPYGLGATIGDSGVLSEWATKVREGGDAPALYPPLQIHLLALMSKLFRVEALYAIKAFQIFGVILVGPVSYLCWRLLLKPAWALAIGITATLPLIDTYRPYPYLVLVAFIPVALYFLHVLRGAADRSKPQLVQIGIATGFGMGLLCLVYSGWLMWSAPGFLITAAVVFPWRKEGRSHGALLCGVAALVFALLTLRYFLGVLDSLPIVDAYMYFDSRVEPAYIGMWRGDLPGVVEKLGIWPPPGELAGVGLFTVILIIGFGCAIAFGRDHVAVIGLTTIIAVIWLRRFALAHDMYDTRLVQLYPRTTAQLVYCSLLLCGFAVYFAIERFRRTASEDSPLRVPAGTIGVICSMILLVFSAASASLDRLSPSEDIREFGNLTWRARMTPTKRDRNFAGQGTIEASSSYEAEGFAKANLLDGNSKSAYASNTSQTESTEEWVEVVFPTARLVRRVVLRGPRGGFPIDFTIQVWDGERWLTRLTRKNYIAIYGLEIFQWAAPDRTDRIRLHVTKLSPLLDIEGRLQGYGLRFTELEVYP